MWQSHIDHSSLRICPNDLSLPSRLLWHSWEELTSTLWSKSVLPHPLNTSRQCKHSHSSHCLWMWVHCVHEHSMFKGTRTKCKPSAAIQQVESCQRSFWQPTGGTCQLQQEDTRHRFLGKSESLTGWPRAGCSSAFLLPLYFYSKVSIGLKILVG